MDDPEKEYEAPTAGREMVARPPRFELDTLRPWEIMFVDEKGYDVTQRGGWTTAFILLDVKSDSWWKVDQTTKKQHPESLAKIIIENGVHLLDYPRTVYTDGCGSMIPVRARATRLGLNAVQIPPHEQSLNEAERIADRAWAIGRTYIVSKDAAENLQALAVDYACYMKLRMATTASREWKTPLEIIDGKKPDITHCVPWYTTANVLVPKTKRSSMIARGLGNLRAETGVFVGYMDMRSTAYKVLLPENQLLRSRNVTFSFDQQTQPSANSPKDPDHAGELIEKMLKRHWKPKSGKAIESQGQGGAQEDYEAPYDIDDLIGDIIEEGNPIMEHSSPPKINRPQRSTQPPKYYVPGETDTVGNEESFDDGYESTPQMDDFHIDISPLQLPEDVEEATLGHDLRQRNQTQPWIPGTADTTGDRVMFLSTVDKLQEIEHKSDIFYASMENAMKKLNAKNKKKGDVEGHIQYAVNLAQQAQKDMSWKKALETNFDEVVKAHDKEMASLLKTILTEVFPEDKDWEICILKATSGRMLLDIKRSGQWKARAVKQGFREDKSTADGPDFSYYSNVVKFGAVRITLARIRHKDRQLWIIDISTAFLQSDSYPDGKVKYLSLKNPITGKWHYYRQSGPIYGEASAPVRWENTLAYWLEHDMGFTRGQNEPSVYYHEERDLLVMTFVDDLLIDGYPEHINWFLDELEQRFDCKDPDMVEEGVSLDYLGMEIMRKDNVIYLSMEKYIENAIRILDIKGRTPTVPISEPIDTTTTPLTPQEKKKFLTALGMLGWLAGTVRCDISYAYSRIAQHSAQPTQSALEAVLRTFAYLGGCKDLCIAISRDEEDHNIEDIMVKPEATPEWRFYSDSDHAGNREVQNKRRSQNGLLIQYNNAAVEWYSKASSVAFASEDIGEAHADVSSAAVEAYAVGNATQHILGLSYVVEEMGLKMAKPFKIEVDNQAAIIFTKGNAQKTKMKHIDCRLEWVRMLRNKEIVQVEHIPTKENLADIFTKILDKSTFEYLRSKILRTMK